MAQDLQVQFLTRSTELPHKLPVIWNKDEVTRLIACVGHIEHPTALSLACGTGLRVGEVVALKVMTAIEQCRTAALGGHLLHCPGCDLDQVACKLP